MYRAEIGAVRRDDIHHGISNLRDRIIGSVFCSVTPWSTIQHPRSHPRSPSIRMQSWIAGSTLALLTCVAAVGCTRRHVADVMTMTTVCDSVPPPLGVDEPSSGLPGDVSVADGAGIVVGVVTEAQSGRPLRGADVSLLKEVDMVLAGVGNARPTATNGSFVLGPYPPGNYVLRIRVIGHHPQEKPVTLRAGTVDTVRTALRYYRCSGY